MKNKEVVAKAQAQLNRLGWSDVAIVISSGNVQTFGTLIFTINDSPVAILEPVYRDGQTYWYAYSVTWKQLPEAEADLDHGLFAIWQEILRYKLGGE